MTLPESPAKEKETILLWDLVTPIFDASMGARLATARMKAGWKQHVLAEKLGLHQRTISSIEQGKLASPRFPFSLSRMQEALGPTLTRYVVLNRHAATIDPWAVRSRYLKKIDETRVKNRKKSEHWTVKRLREGKSVQGEAYQGIPGAVWDLANRIHRENEKRLNKLIKHKEKK